MNNNTLFLPLKAKWYDMIESGEKTEEHREYMYVDSSTIRSSFAYREEVSSKLADDILVRRNHGEWQEPLIEL